MHRWVTAKLAYDAAPGSMQDKAAVARLAFVRKPQAA